MSFSRSAHPSLPPAWERKRGPRKERREEKMRGWMLTCFSDARLSMIAVFFLFGDGEDDERNETREEENR